MKIIAKFNERVNEKLNDPNICDLEKVEIANEYYSETVDRIQGWIQDRAWFKSTENITRLEGELDRLNTFRKEMWDRLGIDPSQMILIWEE